jgi:NADP-dependent 3-hydroxy acid dehydrogenase YdfG
MSSSSNLPFAGRTAVVTGASSGIGAATAKLLVVRGAQVALIARRKERLEELSQQIKQGGGKALAIAIDASDAEAMAKAATTVEETFGPADLFFNNAGVMLPAAIEELRTNDWDRMIGINITGLMNAIGAFVPQLIASAKRGSADLINTSSIAGEICLPTSRSMRRRKLMFTNLASIFVRSWALRTCG